MYVEIVTSSEAKSFKIEFVRLSDFEFAIFHCKFDLKTTSESRFRTDDFVVEAFGAGPLRGRTASPSRLRREGPDRVR